MEFARDGHEQERVENQIVEVENPGGEGERDDPQMNRAGLALVHQQVARGARSGGLGRLYFGDWLHASGYGWLFLAGCDCQGNAPGSVYAVIRFRISEE